MQVRADAVAAVALDRVAGEALGGVDPPTRLGVLRRRHDGQGGAGGCRDTLRRGGINHVILDFKYGARHAGEVLEEIGREVLPRLEGSQPRTEAAE